MAVAALPPGKKSPIDSMRSKFSGLKNNLKAAWWKSMVYENDNIEGTRRLNTYKRTST